MLGRYSAPLVVALALAAAPSAAQSPPSRTLPTPGRPGQLIQPSAQSLVRQPTNLELQVQLSEMRQEVAALSQQVTALTASLTRLSEREADRYWFTIRAAYAGCVFAYEGGPHPDAAQAHPRCQTGMIMFPGVSPGMSHEYIELSEP
jgi:hypothetical protein